MIMIKTPVINDNKSFSLIEVAIALALLALILGGMLEIFNRGFSSARKTRQRAVVYNLARGILEDYSDWDSLDGLDGSVDAVVTNGAYALNPATITLNNVTYTPVLTISDGPTFPNKLKRTSLTVTWAGGSFTLNTLKADY